MFSKEWETFSIGSDESGKGDFFGAPSIAAVKLDYESLQKLKKYRWFKEIKDSKKCTDEWIEEKAPIIIKECEAAWIDLDVSQYLKSYEKHKNMNQVLAIIHNKLHKQLHKSKDLHVIDSFAKQEKYYEYLGNEEIQRIGEFCINGESKYLSIALASIIARYLFIKKIKKISEESGIRIPYGNSYVQPNSVIEAYKELRKKYSEEYIEGNLVKSHFSTLTKIKECLKDS